MIDIPTSTSSTAESASDLLNRLESYVPRIFDFAVNVVIALIVFFIGRLIIKLLIKLIDRFFLRSKVEISVQKFLGSVIRVILYGILIVLICAQVGIETTSFIAIIGSAGLAIGLALQGSLSNFAGGVLILVLKPFKVGDYIINPTSMQEGTVNAIDLFYTSLISADNLMIYIPNGSLANSSIINTSAFDKRRISKTVSVGLTAEVDRAKEIISNLVKGYDKIIQEDGIDIFVKEIAIDKVTIEYRVWVMRKDFWEASCYLVEKGRQALEDNNVEMPNNQIEVHIRDKE